MRSLRKRRALNERGAALIIAYFVMAGLVTLSAGFAMATFQELNDSRRYRDSLIAFGIAEAAINTFRQSPGMLDQSGMQTLSFSTGTVFLSKDDAQPAKRIVTATASVNGTRRSLQVEFPANAPEVFNSTVTINGDIEISGKKVSAGFFDKTRLSGKVVSSSRHPTVYFEDVRQGQDRHLVTMFYPDVNNNGSIDEFDDFVQFNRRLVTAYPQQEVIYLKGDNTYTVVPDSSLKGKKILYVEGSSKGKGNVVVQYAGGWGEKENLTVISTGTVTFNQIGGNRTDSQLNIIAWGDYHETATLAGSHKGMTYTHGRAHFDDIDESSVTYGSLVANDGVSMKEVWAQKAFHYADTRTNGMVPPGFEGLLGGRLSAGYAPQPNVWREI